MIAGFPKWCVDDYRGLARSFGGHRMMAGSLELSFSREMFRFMTADKVLYGTTFSDKAKFRPFFVRILFSYCRAF